MTIDPGVIESIISGVKDDRIIGPCPLDHYMLIRIVICQCHGPAGIVSYMPLSGAPKQLGRLRRDRTETSLPVVVIDEDGDVVHIRTIHWDEPRPHQVQADLEEVRLREAQVQPVLRVNSRGGNA